MNPVITSATPLRWNLRQLVRAASAALFGFALMACNQSPNVGANAASKFSITVRVSSTEKAAQLESKYNGKVLSWHPEAGFAVLSVRTRPPSTDAAIQSVDASAGIVKAPVVPTANRISRPFRNNTANADNAWIGGWTSWSGGWTSWSGGWTSWSGGSSIPDLPAENTVPFAQIRLPEAQAISRNFGEGVKVAVIDTGIDLDHPAFEGRLAPASEWKDFVDGDDVPQEVGTVNDHGYGHGTGVAGIILQVAPKATILPLRVLDQNGSGDLDNVIAAIDWAIAKGAQIINLSLGSAVNQDSLTYELDYAVSKQVYVVASAGNDGTLDGITFPAATNTWTNLKNYVFGIGSVNSDDILSDFSNYGWGLFGVVPGESIYSAFPGNRTASFTGTSFAAPIFTGALALGLKELPTEASPGDFRKYFTDTGRAGQIYTENVTARGTSAIGSGRLDVESLIRNLPNWTPKVDYGTTNLLSNPTLSNNGADWNVGGMISVISEDNHTAVKIEPGSSFYQFVTGLQPNTSYTFSARTRETSLAVGVTMGVSYFGRKDMMNNSRGTVYTQHSITFTTGPGSTSAAVELSSYETNPQPVYAYDLSLRQAGY
jgi:thermitase